MTERNSKFIWQDAILASPIEKAELLIALTMASKDNGDGKGFFYSARSLASHTGYTENHVQKLVKGLIQKGWIEKVSQGGRRGKSHLANTYKLTIPSPDSPHGNEGIEGQVKPESNPQHLPQEVPVDPSLLSSSITSNTGNAGNDGITREDIGKATDVEEDWQSLLSEALATNDRSKIPRHARITQQVLMELPSSLSAAFIPERGSANLFVPDPSIYQSAREERRNRDRYETDLRREGLGPDGTPYRGP